MYTASKSSDAEKGTGIDLVDRNTPGGDRRWFIVDSKTRNVLAGTKLRGYISQGEANSVFKKLSEERLKKKVG